MADTVGRTVSEVAVQPDVASPPDDDPAHRGKTFITDEVVSVIARIAAEQVEGVHQIGESTLRSRLPGANRKWGVASAVGMKEAAIDVEIVVEFGYPIAALAEDLRRQVIESVEFMTGRHVVEVNVHIRDVFIPKVERQQKRQLE